MKNIFGSKYYFVVMHLSIMLVIILIFSNLLSVFADREKRVALFGPETDSEDGQNLSNYPIKSYFLYILIISMLVILIAEVFLRLISRKINNLSS